MQNGPHMANIIETDQFKKREIRTQYERSTFGTAVREADIEANPWPYLEKAMARVHDLQAQVDTIKTIIYPLEGVLTREENGVVLTRGNEALPAEENRKARE